MLFLIFIFIIQHNSCKPKKEGNIFIHKARRKTSQENIFLAEHFTFSEKGFSTHFAFFHPKHKKMIPVFRIDKQQKEQEYL